MIVGIDAGGTGSTAVAYEHNGVLHTVSGGVGNLKRIGYDGAVELVKSLCEQLSAQANRSVEGICIGLAGAGKPEEREQLRQQISIMLGVPVRVETDAAIALHGAFDGGAGMLLIAGTGSIAYGIAAGDAEPTRVGGWGWQLGDEGSGCWLGREAIRCVLLGYDGRGNQPEFSDALLKQLQIHAPIDLIPLIYSSEWTPARYGELAPLVLEWFPKCHVAKQLIRLASGHLARHLRALQDRLGGEERAQDVALSGGLIANETHLRNELLAELEHVGTFRIVEAKFTPAVGAARMVSA